jgi:eukaryotic-like serine/threonine-protein kinase
VQAPAAAPPPPPASVSHRRPALTSIPARRFLPGDRICSGLLACEPLATGDRTERWLAWSERHWSRVVVKLPREEHMDDLRAVRRLAREGRALRRLSHPAVPRLLEDRHDHPVPHLVLEHVEALSLDQVVLAGGPLPPADVVRLGMRLASCLHHVHGQGLVHLGIEPAGIAGRDGHGVLLDLGSARPAGGSPPPGRACATPYQAPEHCLRARPDARMDLFSLGAVLYEAATGRPPFRTEEAVPGCAHPQLLVVPRRASDLSAELPADLDAVIHALLERDPRRRPGSAIEVLRLLASALPADEARAWPPFADRLLDAG